MKINVEKPRRAVLDDGAEFRSNSLTLGIKSHYAPLKTPCFKAEMERFLGTLSASLLHGTPGTTSSDIFEKDGRGN